MYACVYSTKPSEDDDDDDVKTQQYVWEYQVATYVHAQHKNIYGIL